MIIDRFDVNGNSIANRLYHLVDNEVISLQAKVIADGSKRLDQYAYEYYGESLNWWIIASASGLGWWLNLKTNNDIMKPFKENTQNIVSNNPITASYESGMSRGIAGFITQLDVNYGDSNWETSRIGSKAPMLVKVTINFSPIHDIVPGIDHNGMMRAPTYNVGRVNNTFFGDPHDGSIKNSGIQPAHIQMRKLQEARYKKAKDISEA